MKHRSILLCGTLCLLIAGMMLAGSASAAELTDTISWTTTNWSKSLTLAKFDPTLGTLTSITIDLAGAMFGTVKFENKDAAAQWIQVTQTGSELFTLPDGSAWGLGYAYDGPCSTPTSVPAFDGTVDFNGTSGFSATKSVGDTHQWVTSDALVLAALTKTIGSDEFTIPVLATGTSYHSASANYADFLRLQAMATASVTYTYTQEVIPEAGSMVLFLSGMSTVVGFARLRQRSRK